MILCLKDLSIDMNGVLKSFNIIVLLSVSPFLSVSICFMYLGTPVFGVGLPDGSAVKNQPSNSRTRV